MVHTLSGRGLALAVAAVLGVGSLAAAADETTGLPCEGAVKQDIDELAKRFTRIGAKGAIVEARCNARGNLSRLTIYRASDKRTTHWKPREGLAVLFDRVMAGQ